VSIVIFALFFVFFLSFFLGAGGWSS